MKGNYGRTKYGNKKCVYAGIKFDSIKEKNRYIVLLDKVKCGEISNLELQPKFLLQDKYKYEGKTVRALSYIGDFRYTTKNGVSVTEDVKAAKNFTTEVYKIKKKLLLFKYPDLKFVEIF